MEANRACTSSSAKKGLKSLHAVYAATLAEMLALVELRAVNELTEPESLERVRHVAESLPASVAGFFGFERRLGRANAGTDFALSLSRFGRDWLLDSNRWPQLANLVATWRAHFASDADAVWLEFDTSRRVADERVPNAFVALDRRESGALARPAAITAAIENFYAAIGCAAKAPPALSACIDAIPPSVGRLQLGFMFSRATSPIRLCLLSLAFDEALSFLRAVSWPGSLDRVAAVIEPYAPLCDGFGVHVDVLDGIAPSVGVELLYDARARESQPDKEGRWSALFARLVEDGLCSDREREALFGWVAQRTFAAPLIERLIASVSPSGELLLYGTLYTGLQHVKLSLDAEGTVFAKAYFGATLATDA